MLGIAAAGAVLGLSSQVQGANSFGQIQRLLDGEHPTGAFQAFVPSPTPEASSSAVEGSTPVQEPPATPEAPPPAQTETEPAVKVEVAESAATAEFADDVCPDEGSGGLYCVYTVQEGDTLSGIAAALGLEGTAMFSAAHLISFSNGLGDPDQAHIQPGQELRIPVLSGVLHTVGASEFLSALAAAYGISMDEIMAMNGLVDADSLREGTLLLIPSPSSIPSDGGVSATLLASEESDTDEAEETLAVLDEDDSDDSESGPSWSFSSQSIFNREFPSSSPVGQVSTSDASDEDVTEESATEDEDEPADVEEEEPQENDANREDEEPEEPEDDLRAAVAASEEDESSDDESSTDEDEDASTEEEGDGERERSEDSNEDRDAEGNREDNEATPTPTPEGEEEEDEPSPTAVPTESPAPTATPTPTPTQAPRPQAASNPSVETIKQEFTAGYRSAGGSEGYLSHILNTVIPCESSYNVRAYNPAGPYYGLMQFLEATWMRVGGGDWYDPWQQGANTARLLQSARPETQWPYCWKR